MHKPMMKKIENVLCWITAVILTFVVVCWATACTGWEEVENYAGSITDRPS